MRFKSKKDLVGAIETEHRVFLEITSSIPKRRYGEEGVWGEGWTVSDLFFHLTAWERMFLGWYADGLGGETPDLPAAGYKWNETPRLNREIWSRGRRKSRKKILEEFDVSFDEIFALTRSLPEKDLLTPGRFDWTGKHPLATYLAPNTCSHYRAATKILKRWLRQNR